jgi:serine/threonine-protein kinase
VQDRIIKERYRLIKQLGQGGMGSVWRAEDLNLHIDVAVKLIDPNFATSDEAQARFQREALAAAQLRSMHIVWISDHGVDGDTPFIVMELLRGESLATRLRKRGVLSFDEALSVFSQIAEALGFAHEQKIVHRDLKPDNVFIVSERTRELVKVLDFGVAKKIDSQSFGNKLKTHTGMLLGTPYYMSPEQTRGSAAVDHRSDIWSFGVMVYECITGKRPFEADTIPDLLMAICRDPFVPASQIASVPAGFDEWFAQAAARDVSERFQSIEAAVNALNSLRGAEITAPRQPAPSVASVDVRTVRITQDDPIPKRFDSRQDATNALSPNTVVPSSVTAPPGAKTESSRRSLGWLLAPLVAAVGVLAYWLWPSSDASPEREPAASTQHAASPAMTETPATSVASTAAAIAPAVAVAPSATTTSSVATPAASAATAGSAGMKLPNNPDDSTHAATKPSTSKPGDLAPARQPRPAPASRPAPISTKPFGGGF